MTESTKAAGNLVTAPEQAEEGSKSSSVTDFVRDHPGLVVAGGLAIGLLAGGFLARGSGRKIAKHAITLAELAGTASLALGRDALERAEDAGTALRHQGEVLGEKAARVGDAVGEKASKLAEPAGEAIEAGQEAAARLLRKAVELAGRLRS